MYSKVATERILAKKGIQVKLVEAVRQLKNVIHVVYLTKNGRCSTFVSLRDYKQDFEELRDMRAEELVVVERAMYVWEVFNIDKRTSYMVNYVHHDGSLKCGCKDSFYGNNCKHQRAIARRLGFYSLEEFLNRPNKGILQKTDFTVEEIEIARASLF